MDIERGNIKDDMGIAFLSEPKFGLGQFKGLLHKYCYHKNRNKETWRAKDARID
jgi:hypothetical protein